MLDNKTKRPANSLTFAELESRGVISRISAGIQIDINAAVRRAENGSLIDASLCDHNCTVTLNGQQTGGNYNCPAAISLNSGFVRHSFAARQDIVNGINKTIAGIRLANERFIKNAFPQYCEDFRIPDQVAATLKEVILAGKIEINLFGGNPEMHPDITTIIAELGRQGHVVNLTTTGRRFMRSADFFAEVMQSPPYILALSADDFESATHIHELAELSMDELYRAWKQIPWFHGQRQKAYEAFFVAKRITQAQLDRPKVLFNLVLHPKNMAEVESIMQALTQYFPACIVNPYPAQAAFMYEAGVFDESQLKLFGLFIDKMIAFHTDGSADLWPVNLTKRLHYWLILKAAYELYQSSPRMLSDIISGSQIWRCYKNFGANRYIQIGRSSPTHPSKQAGGGYLGCFWNANTVTFEAEQVWNMSDQSIGNYITTGHQQTASQSVNKCPGCNFPRLMFDIVSSELGLAEELVSVYLQLRQEYMGY